MALAMFSIKSSGTTSTITVDGNEIHGVTGFTLTHNVNDIPHLELDLAVVSDEPTEGEARVYISERVREGLLALGWTPPEDDSAAA